MTGPSLGQLVAAYRRAEAEFAREIAMARVHARRAKASLQAIKRRRAEWRKQHAPEIRKAAKQAYWRDHTRSHRSKLKAGKIMISQHVAALRALPRAQECPKA